MLSILFRLVMTIIYGGVGLALAFPLSYFFQSRIYHEMTWVQYCLGGTDSLRIGVDFGALDAYRYAAIAAMIGAIGIGSGVEWYVGKRMR